MPARLRCLSPKPALGDPQAVTHDSVPRALLLEDRHDDVAALEDLPVAKVRHRTIWRRAEAMRGRSDTLEGLGPQHGLQRDPLDGATRLPAPRAPLRRRRLVNCATTAFHHALPDIATLRPSAVRPNTA